MSYKKLDAKQEYQGKPPSQIKYNLCTAVENKQRGLTELSGVHLHSKALRSTPRKIHITYSLHCRNLSLASVSEVLTQHTRPLPQYPQKKKKKEGREREKPQVASLRSSFMLCMSNYYNIYENFIGRFATNWVLLCTVPRRIIIN